MRQTDRGRRDRLPYWPITFSLDHSTLCYPQHSLSTSAFRLELHNWWPLRATAQSWPFSLTATGSDSGLHRLQLYQVETTQLEAAPPQWGPLTDCNWLWLRPSPSPTLSTGCSNPQRGALADCKLILTLAFNVSNWLKCHEHLHILFHNAHLIRSRDILPLIYTGASLIDSSVKGHYVTLLLKRFKIYLKKYF